MIDPLTVIVLMILGYAIGVILSHCLERRAKARRIREAVQRLQAYREAMINEPRS